MKSSVHIYICIPLFMCYSVLTVLCTIASLDIGLYTLQMLLVPLVDSRCFTISDFSSHFIDNLNFYK